MDICIENVRHEASPCASSRARQKLISEGCERCLRLIQAACLGTVHFLFVFPVLSALLELIAEVFQHHPHVLDGRRFACRHLLDSKETRE